MTHEGRRYPPPRDPDGAAASSHVPHAASSPSPRVRTPQHSRTKATDEAIGKPSTQIQAIDMAELQWLKAKVHTPL